jgi:benzoate-CoA ligase family protein
MSALEIPERLNAAAVLVDSHIAAGRGDKAALLCGERTVTYAALCEGVNRFGNVLKTLGLRMEERVAILMPDTPEFVFAFFGAMKMGAVSIPLNTLLGPPDYQYLLNDSRARVLVVHAGLLDRIAGIRPNLRHLHHILVAGGEAEGCPNLENALAAASPTLEAADTSKDDAAFWLYSSGTTGFPKGAIHLHHDMIVSADLYARQTIGLEEGDVSFSVAKLFFAYGLGNGLYFPLRVGGTTVLLPDRPTPDKVFETLDRHRPTVFYSVPTSFAQLLHAAENTGRTSLGGARMCVSAGEPLPKPIFEKWRDRFGVEILDGIGSTEILHIFISNRPGRAKAGSTGLVVPGYEARIVDDHGRDVPVGEIGNLLIRGDSIASGYWNKHAETKRTFMGEWINTRDKYRADADGYYWYAGRSDDLMKVSGMAVWPSDVEALLQAHPAVLESGVAAATDEEGLVKPYAYVVLKDGHPPSAELAKELQEFVRKGPAPYKYPRWVEFVDALPKTATGKIKRYQLRQMAAAKTASQAH